MTTAAEGKAPSLSRATDARAVSGAFSFMRRLESTARLELIERGAVEPLVTKGDLNDLRDFITDEMRRGFAGVHARQDITNGRVGRSEVEIGKQDVRLKNIEREVFHRRRTDRPRIEEGVTTRDVRVVWATLAAVGAVVMFFWKLLPAIQRVLGS